MKSISDFLKRQQRYIDVAGIIITRSTAAEVIFQGTPRAGTILMGRSAASARSATFTAR